MHKTKLFFVAGACLALSGTRRVGAEPFDESKGAMFYALSNPVRKAIIPTANELPVDEAIIALSKASDFNFLADATQIPAATRVAPFPATPVARANKWQTEFVNVSEDLEEAAQLAELRYSERTYLLWKRPDVVETARALVAADKLHTLEALPDELEIYNALTDLQQNMAKNDPPPSSFFMVAGSRLGDLPMKLRDSTLALARYAALRPDWKRELLLSDAYWKTARIVLAPAPYGPARKLVYVGGQDENGRALPFFRAFERQLRPLDYEEKRTTYPTAPIEAPVPVAQEEAPVVTGLTASELEAQTPLQAPVSIEVRRRPLSAVLADASKQSGVALSLAADVPARSIIGRVQQMPLHELMGALGRLCGASWHKSNAGFELRTQALPAWQTLLLQSGRGDFAGHGLATQFTPEQLQPLRDLEQAIADEIGDRQTPQGVAVSALSEALQTQLKATAQGFAAEALVRSYKDAFVFSSPDSLLYVAPPRRFIPAWRLHLLLADKRKSLVLVDVRPPVATQNGDVNTPLATGTIGAAPAPDAPLF